MATTFGSCTTRVDSLRDLFNHDDDDDVDGIYIDPNIPDLVAVNNDKFDVSNCPAYKNGQIILQDKASCFPAYLLLGDGGGNNLDDQGDGEIIDSCAAPGNKTTHMASLLHARKKRNKIWAMDASLARSKTLEKLVSVAGANDSVSILPGQDFLAVDPLRFSDVTRLLLDPSCSGSGIVGRDDVPNLVLPDAGNHNSKKRKFKSQEYDHGNEEDKTSHRLTKLSNLQTRIVEHAMHFPSAARISYSTCSIHSIENEHVVARVLASDIAKRRGWRVIRREEQPEGLSRW